MYFIYTVELFFSLNILYSYFCGEIILCRYFVWSVADLIATYIFTNNLYSFPFVFFIAIYLLTQCVQFTCVTNWSSRSLCMCRCISISSTVHKTTIAYKLYFNIYYTLFSSFYFCSLYQYVSTFMNI